MALRPSGGDTYGPSDTAALVNKMIPQIFSSKILTRFYEKTIYTSITNTEYEGEISKFGDKVFIRYAPDVTITAHTVGDTITYEELDSVATELNIDLGFRWGFQLMDEDEHQIDMDIINSASDNAARLLQIKVEKEMFQYMSTAASPLNFGAFAGYESGVGGSKGTLAGGVDTANTSVGIDLGAAGAPISVTSTTAVNYIVLLNQVLDEQNIPDDGRWVVIPAWFASLLKLGDLKRADVTGDSTGVIRSGLIGKIDRTMVYQSNNLYSVTDGTTSTKCHNILAGTNLATTFAAQITKSEQLRIQDQFGNYYRGLLVYGRKVVRPEALAVLYADLG